MSSLQFTDADRDIHGRLRVEPTRSFADLLPESPAVVLPAPSRPALVASRGQLLGGLLAVLIALLAVVYMIARPAPATAPRALPSAAPTSPQPPAASPRAPQSPAAPVAGLTLARAVVAYAAPAGAVIGPIEAGRAYTPTARLGLDWTQIEALGSGLVWVRAIDVAPDASLLDLATPTPRPLPTSPPAPAIVYQQAPPAPTQCARVSGGGTSVERCGAASLDDLQAEAQQAWAEQFGGNRVSVATVTPAIWR